MVETFLNIKDFSYLYPLEMWAILFGVIILFFFYMSTQEGEEGFKLVTSASWGVVPNRLSYPLRTVLLFLFGHKMYEKVKLKTSFEYFRFLFGNQLDQNIDSNELSDIQAWYKWAEEQLSLVWDLFSHISPNFKK
jgi:hypothetical protein